MYLEYASEVFHHSLPKYLSRDVEQIHKRALSIVYPALKYKDTLTESGLLMLDEEENWIVRSFSSKF